MKKILTLLAVIMSITVFSQNYTGDKFTARISIKSPLYFKGTDTLISKLDTANANKHGSLSNYMYNRILGGSSKWTLNGSDIYRMSKVGIGVSAPLRNLQINDTDSAIIRLYTSLDDRYWDIKSINENPNALIFKCNSGKYCLIDDLGRFGVNKIPGYELDVNGSINGTSYYLNGSQLTQIGHDSVTIGTSNGLTRTGKQVLNLGLASTSTTGALSNTDWNTFNGKIGGSGTANYVAKFTGSGTIGNSIIQDDGTYLGFGTAPNSSYIASFGSGNVNFSGGISGITTVFATSTVQSAVPNTTTAQVLGLSAVASTASTPGTTERCSPMLRFTARAWNTTPTAATKSNEMAIRVRGISGTTTSGRMVFENVTVDGVSNTNELMGLTTGGYLGIGITSPQNMLHINDGANATYTQFTNTATGSTATDGAKIGIESDGDLAIVQQENDSIKLFTNSTLAASINGAGYISYKSSFADISVVGNVTAQSIPTGTTYTKITAYTTNGESSNCTADAANDKITITKKGRYRITANSSSYTDNAGVKFIFQLFAGGSAITNIAPSERKFSNANDITGGLAQGLYNASTVPVDIDIRCIHDSGTSQNITVKNSNLNVEYIGE